MKYDVHVALTTAGVISAITKKLLHIPNLGVTKNDIETHPELYAGVALVEHNPSEAYTSSRMYY